MERIKIEKQIAIKVLLFKAIIKNFSLNRYYIRRLKAEIHRLANIKKER